MTAIILYLTSFKIILFRLFCYFIFLLYLWHIFQRNQPYSIMLRKLYLYVLLFVSVSAFSQVKVEGTVIDELSSKPLQGVKVRVSTSPREAVTNSKGKYSIARRGTLATLLP